MNFLNPINIRCDFYLVGVELSKQVYLDEIHYIDNMPYLENLQHVVSSKFLLEIMQKGGHGSTQRMSEELAYNKKILTNKKEVEGAPSYNDKDISIYSDIKDIDISLLRDGSHSEVDYGFKD